MNATEKGISHIFFNSIFKTIIVIDKILCHYILSIHWTISAWGAFSLPIFRCHAIHQGKMRDFKLVQRGFRLRGTFELRAIAGYSINSALLVV
ncbi:hypothetical protein DA11_04565 [Aeromonas caviae]|nr:hypothetical protein DA11_04565 [Aeromonas caviae]